MNNFKIDEENTSKVISSYENLMKNEKIFNIINQYKYLVEKYKLKNLIKNIPYIQSEYVGKILIINNVDAFDSDQIKNYNFLDKEYSDILNVYHFELNSLTQQKRRAVGDFNIADAVKLNDKIATLNVKIAETQSKISKINREIADYELDFKSQYEKFVSGYEKDKGKFSTNQFDNKILKSYFINKNVEIIQNVTNELNNEELCKVLENDEIKGILENYYQVIINRVNYHVGTDI